MDTEKLINNTVYYEKFDGNPDNFGYSLEMYIVGQREYDIKIWEGYISDLFREPVFNENGWTGFTRDYQEEKGTYGRLHRTIDIDEYLSDLLTYKGRKFHFEETNDCLELMLGILEYAQENGREVNASWAENFCELEDLSDNDFGDNYWEQFDFGCGRIVSSKTLLDDEMLTAEFTDKFTVKAGYIDYMFHVFIIYNAYGGRILHEYQCYKKDVFRKIIALALKEADEQAFHGKKYMKYQLTYNHIKTFLGG